MAIAASALEPLYYPDILGRLRLDMRFDIGEFQRWRSVESTEGLCSWLQVDHDWLFEQAGRILEEADHFDPLGRWAEVIAHGSPERWADLRGDARSAIDLRIVAEILLRDHDALVDPSPKPTARASTTRRRSVESRLARRRPLDAVLTDFDLSPHPGLVVVVEGATERMIWPRVLDRFGMSVNEELISVVDREGVRKSIDALVAYIAPRLDPDPEVLRLTRPPTRLLVVSDPEGPMETALKRQEQRARWIARIVATFPQPYRTPTVRDQIEHLVFVETWNRLDDSFEFAHFTDRQIATALRQLPGRQASKGLADLTKIVNVQRAKRANIVKAIAPSVSKTDLADTLWPILETKISNAAKRGTEGRIPIVRVIDVALALANELPRRGVMIATAPRQPAA